MQSFFMMQKSFDELRQSIEKMIREDRPRIIKDIATARAHGDLSENAEFHAAKEEQRILENRLKEKETILRNAKVVPPEEVRTDCVQFGVYVTLLDSETEKKVSYHIVGDIEADIPKKCLSMNAPLGKALMGKVVGDDVMVETPSGEKFYTILRITKS